MSGLPSHGPSAVHHISCATMCPTAARVPGLMPSELVAHCLVVEGAAGLTLVDTGFGLEDVKDGGRRLGRAFVTLAGARLDPAQTAHEQVRALGRDPHDVRDIVLTHLDLDHAGGLSDFPWARVHVHANELRAARNPTRREQLRYVTAQWRHGPDWVEHRTDGDDWFGFRAVQAVGDDIWMIPLHGHTRGHSGVVVRRPGGGWLLHAGDAYFAAGDKETPRTCPPGLRAYQAGLAVDGRQRRDNLARLQELHRQQGLDAPAGEDHVTVFCAHDRSELVALQGSA
jgi:glyoxylase-like metal-dependent hydrolase (beta-lactamase superfamily II)